MERGERIRGRKRLIAAGAVAAGVIVVVGISWSFRLFGDDLIGPRFDPVDSVAEANARLTTTITTDEWAAVPAVLGFTPLFTSDGEVLYALSTAPGARWEDFPGGNVPKAVYLTADGSDWESRPLPGPWVTSLAAAGDLLYAVGTAPGAEAGDEVEIQVALSRDRGESFEITLLPLATPRQAGSLTAEVIPVGEGAMVIGRAVAWTDMWSLVPPEILEEAFASAPPPAAGYAAVEVVQLREGVAAVHSPVLVDPTCAVWESDECQNLVRESSVWYSSWEELGLDPDEVVIGQSEEQVAYWSEKGGSFTRIDYPFPGGRIEHVASTGKGTFVAVATPGGSRLFQSNGPRAWREITGDIRIGGVSAIGTIADHVVVVGSTRDFPTVPGVWRSADMASWQVTTLPQILAASPELADASGAFATGEAWLAAAAVGEGGVAFSAQTWIEDQGQQPTGFRELVNLFLGREEAFGGAPLDLTVFSNDLAAWTLVPTVSSQIHSLVFTPSGHLVAHRSTFTPGATLNEQLTIGD